MDYKFSFTRVSGNTKTGPIPVTMTSSNSCPASCIFKGAGCYAEAGRPRIWWNRLDTGTWGIDWTALLDNIKALPAGTLWRKNQAGDLPHDSGRINAPMLRQLVKANKGRRGFTYTHHSPFDPETAASIKHANDNGFTVNLSADTPAEADAMHALGVGPVVCTLPDDLPAEQNRSTQTPAGNTIVQCPATYREDIQCANCSVCAVATRRVIIGFPVHGVAKAKARKVISIKSDAIEGPPIARV